MDKMIIFSLLSLFLSANAVNAQKLSDEQAIEAMLQGKNIDGKFTWRPTDKNLKKLAYQKMTDGKTPITTSGLWSVTSIFTRDEYDALYDSLFLNILISKLDRDSIFRRLSLISLKFLRSNYNAASIEKLTHYKKPQTLLLWESRTPYYLAFLQIGGIDSTLLFLKENIHEINRLHYKLYKTYEDEFDTTEINVCLARLGKLNDTLVCAQLEDQLYNGTRRTHYNAVDYVEKLSRIRTPYAFQKIGDLLVADLSQLTSKNTIEDFRTAALDAFRMYVKNFPDQSTKQMDVINWPKAYSTEYLEMAKRWYLENKDRLILDYDKY